MFGSIKNADFLSQCMEERGSLL